MVMFSAHTSLSVDSKVCELLNRTPVPVSHMCVDTRSQEWTSERQCGTMRFDYVLNPSVSSIRGFRGSIVNRIL